MARIAIQDVDFVPEAPLPNFAFEALSMVRCHVGIVFPEIAFSLDNVSVVNPPFLYDFRTKQVGKSLGIEANGMYPYRVTDATDMDAEGNFWLLSLNRFET